MVYTIYSSPVLAMGWYLGESELGNSWVNICGGSGPVPAGELTLVKGLNMEGIGDDVMKSCFPGPEALGSCTRTDDDVAGEDTGAAGDGVLSDAIASGVWLKSSRQIGELFNSPASNTERETCQKNKHRSSTYY